MTLFRSILLAAAPLAAALSLPAGAAQAQDAKKAISFAGSAAFVSDYRFRGISYSNLDPAVQASLTMNTAPGFFVAMWGSSIAEYAGSNTEIDIYGGWTGALGPTTTTVGLYTYNYPGSSGTFVYELYGSVAMPMGPVTGTIGLNWAPGQDNLRSSSRYLYGTLSAAIPGTPISLTGTLGHERGGLVADELGTTTQKLDWQIGATITYAPVTLGIAYVGNDLPRTTQVGGYRPNEMAKDGVVVTLSASF